MDPFMQNYLLPWLNLMLVAFLPVAGTIAMAWARKRGISADVLNAAGRAAGVGYEALITSGVPITSPRAKEIVAAAGREYLVEMMPNKVRATGWTDEAIERVVAAEWSAAKIPAAVAPAFGGR